MKRFLAGAVAIVAVLALGLPATPAATTVPVADDHVRTAIQDVSDWTDLRVVQPAHIPMPAASTGIGPGSPLIIDMAGGLFLCTANFVWTDGTKQYLGSAGHCFLPSGKVATHGEGADYNPANTSVEVCVANCIFGGELTLLSGTYVSLGSPTYARQSRGAQLVGEDFGIIEIPSSLSSQVRPAMPVFGGPGPAEPAQAFRTACHYGNGVGVAETFLTKGREAVTLGGSNNSWTVYGVVNGGDSGSAIEYCSADAGGVHGGGALGIVTHLSVSATGVKALGTTVSRAITLAQEANVSLSLVTAPH